MRRKSFTLLAAIFLALFLGIIMGASFLRTYIQLRSVEIRKRAEDAFYVAEAGIEASIFELRRDAEWRDGFDNEAFKWHEGEADEQTIGYYTVTVSEGADLGDWPTVLLRAEGRVPNPFKSGQYIKKVILARVAVQNPAAFFTATPGYLKVVSGASINGDILGGDVVFDVNHSYPPDKRKITIDGDVLYTQNISGQDDPDVEITGNVSSLPPITFTGVDLDYYEEVAQNGGRYIDGDFHYSGDIDKENLSTNNGVVYVNGDVYISGDVLESVQIVASGNIYITDDIICQNDAQIGLSAKESVIIPESAPDSITIEAFIRADGGTFEAEGDKGSKDTLTFSGAISVRGDEGEEDSSGIDLNVYAERNYNYDTSLYTDLSIPYITYIANVVEWNQAKSISEDFPEDWKSEEEG